jgi:predicted MFS family arabinose efflux permease
VQTTATLPLHVRDVHLSNSFYGALLGLNALMCVLIELPLIRFTAHRHPGRVLAVGMILQSIGVGPTGIADTRLALLATVIVWSLAETIYSPMAQVFPGLLAPEHLRGRYQGAEGIAATLAQTVGPALGGYLYSAQPNLHWEICGALGLVAAAIILAADDPRKRATAATPTDVLQPVPTVLATET